MKAFILIITFSIILAFSHATPTLVTLLQSQKNQSSTFNLTQQQINETKLMESEKCPYKITIKTSCSSPISSEDVIGVQFGDATDDHYFITPEYTILERCETLTYYLIGNCMSKICKLYVARRGTDGWMPETITAYHFSKRDYPPAIFNFNYFIPEGKRHGFNYCDH